MFTSEVIYSYTKWHILIQQCEVQGIVYHACILGAGLGLDLLCIISNRFAFQWFGPLCDFRCTLLLQLHFNSFHGAYRVPIELILCIMER